MHTGKFLTLTLALGLLSPLAACNTFEGFGEDLESLGKSIQTTGSDESGKSGAQDNITGKDTTEKDRGGNNASRFNKWQEPRNTQR